MKRLFIYVFLILVSAMTVAAQTRSSKNQIARLAQKIAETDDLGRLDRLGLIRGSVRIVIQHSIAEPEFEIKRFRSFKAAERWLDSREIDGFPMRMSMSFKGCGKSVCTFESEGGILHNRLYTKKVIFGYRKNRPYVKAVQFLDGD